MFSLFMKRIWRNKWLLIKMFVFSPFISILPVILINQYTVNISSERILCMCIWSFIYFSTFENVNLKIRDGTGSKMVDILLSERNIFEKHLLEKVALIFSFLPSFFLSLIMYIKIYNLDLNINKTIYSIVCMILFANFIMDSSLYLELRYKNYFHKFNVFMNIMYILAGILYEITSLPIFLRIFSYLIPITYVFHYIYSDNSKYILIFIPMLTLYTIITKMLLIHVERQYRRFGGAI